MKRTIEDIKEYLTHLGFEDSVVFENPSYVDAVVGVTTEGNVIYDYDKMVESLYEEFRESESSKDEEELRTMAIEFIDYNTIRSIPYSSSVGIPPIIMYPLLEEYL